ncbi:MAG: AsmA family protein [Alphaproteobacteria bacterium]|nr:AsmA family protein [Alphaproteobacteria bacterium]
MRRMTRRTKFLIIARAIFLFFAVSVVAVVVALSKIDTNSLRENILGILRSSTGMPVEIAGDVSWKLSLRPHVVINKITVPNAPGEKHKNLFEADTLEVRLNLLSLFRNRPTIQHVRIKNGKLFWNDNINAENNKDDKNTDTAESAAQGEIQKTEYPFMDPGLGGIDVVNFEINVDDEKYFLPRVNIRAGNFEKNREYRGWIKLKKNVIPFILSFDKYNAERKVYPVKFAFSSEGDTLIANIALEGTSKIPIDFIIKGDIPDVRPIGDMLNIELPKMPEIKVNISGGLGHSKVTVHKSSISVRGSDINFSGALDWSKKRLNMTANISSKKINLMELFPEIYGSTPHLGKYKPNVFKDMPLYGKYLHDTNAVVNVDVGQMIVYRKLSLNKMKVNASVRDAVLRIDANVGFADGNVTAAINGDIDADGRINLEMGGVGRGMVMGTLLEQINTNDFISELPIDFEMYVRASGTNMSEVMHTINGPVRVYSAAGGYAHSDLVAYMYGTDFLTSLQQNIHDLFASKKKYDQMKIHCLATNLKLRNGLIETQNGVAVETNAINVMLDGNLDLGREKMSMSLTTIPVRGLKLSITGNVVNTITISGNLAEPDIKISGAAVAGKALSATGLGLLLAPFTGGLGLVAGAGVGLLAGDLLENWLADEHPCKTALKKGAPARRNDPEWLDESALDLANGVIKPDSAGVSNK